MKERKSFEFNVKSSDLNEDGTFIGRASTYGNVDQGGDIVVAGAFTKTLQERGTRYPLLWSHKSDRPIGNGYVEDSDSCLIIKGELNLDTQDGRDAYSNIKKGIVQGLSIGFETIKKNIKDGIRQLTELKLFEVSLCVFPMNELANVQAVKEAQDLHDAIDLGEKVGRRHSAATISKLAAIAKEIETLLATEAAGDSTSTEVAVLPEAPKAMANAIEPELLHSLVDRYTKSITGELIWQK